VRLTTNYGREGTTSVVPESADLKHSRGGFSPRVWRHRLRTLGLANWLRLALVIAAGTAMLVSLSVPVHAQEVLAPDASAAKAKQLIQQAIQALGDQAYLGVHDAYCEGRLAQFSSQGELSGYERFYDFWLLPDKNRTEYSKKRNIIETYNGDQGWVLDKAGVEVASADSVDSFKENLYRSADYLFRFRMDEPGLNFRYAGSDIVDLKRVDWVEVSDRERRTLRIALDQKTHLPRRVVSTVRDRATRQRLEEAEYYSNWFNLQGVMTPKQVTREHSGRTVYQVFYDTCKYNTGQQESFFTREALEQRWAELSKGKKKK